MPETGDTIRADTIVRKTADETVNNNAAWQSDNHLLFPVVAGDRYLAHFVLFTLMNTGGIQVALTGPAITVYTASALGIVAANMCTIARVTNWDVAAATVVPAGAVHGMISLDAYIQCSASGNVNLRWTQAVALANNTTITLGSWLRVLRVP